MDKETEELIADVESMLNDRDFEAIKTIPLLCNQIRKQGAELDRVKNIPDGASLYDGCLCGEVAPCDKPCLTCEARLAQWDSLVAERDALRADATLWRNGMKVIDELRAAVIPCGHTVGDLIGGHGAVTKCGACLASIREHRATLATRLKAAIRRQTVDVDDGNTPNGPVEQAMETIANILNSTTLVATAKTSRRMLIETFVRLTAAMAADCKELREAADAYFGEDFTQPPPPPTQP